MNHTKPTYISANFIATVRRRFVPQMVVKRLRHFAPPRANNSGLGIIPSAPNTFSGGIKRP